MSVLTPSLICWGYFLSYNCIYMLFGIYFSVLFQVFCGNFENILPFSCTVNKFVVYLQSKI